MTELTLEKIRKAADDLESMKRSETPSVKARLRRDEKEFFSRCRTDASEEDYQSFVDEHLQTKSWEDDDWKYEISRTFGPWGKYKQDPKTMVVGIRNTLLLTRKRDGVRMLTAYVKKEYPKPEEYLPKFDKLKRQVMEFY